MYLLRILGSYVVCACIVQLYPHTALDILEETVYLLAPLYSGTLQLTTIPSYRTYTAPRISIETPFIKFLDTQHYLLDAAFVSEVPFKYWEYNQHIHDIIRAVENTLQLYKTNIVTSDIISIKDTRLFFKNHIEQHMKACFPLYIDWDNLVKVMEYTARCLQTFTDNASLQQCYQELNQLAHICRIIGAQ